MCLRIPPTRSMSRRCTLVSPQGAVDATPITGDCVSAFPTGSAQSADGSSVRYVAELYQPPSFPLVDCEVDIATGVSVSAPLSSEFEGWLSGSDDGSVAQAAESPATWNPVTSSWWFVGRSTQVAAPNGYSLGLYEYPLIATPPPDCVVSGSTILVNTASDDGIGCTLREAITLANGTAGLQTITFDIPGAGVRTIQPASGLPLITQPLVIDATSQPGYAGTPLIELDGTLDTGNRIGFWALSTVTIEGLVINRFGNRAILLDSGSDGSVVRANYLGTTPDGAAALGTFSFNALEVRSSNNTVGGTSPADRNVIAGVLRVGPFGGTATGNVVQGNYLGVDATGTTGLNSPTGIVVGRTRPTRLIGGTAPGAGNVISGNNGNGIQIDVNATGTIVQGNLIGTNAAGTTAVPNTTAGMQVYGPGTIIGGTSPERATSSRATVATGSGCRRTARSCRATHRHQCGRRSAR